LTLFRIEPFKGEKLKEIKSEQRQVLTKELSRRRKPTKYYWGRDEKPESHDFPKHKKAQHELPWGSEAKQSGFFSAIKQHS